MVARVSSSPAACSRMKVILVGTFLLAVGHVCLAKETAECSVAKVGPGKAKGGARALEFTTPVTNGRRVSSCFGANRPTCSTEESQKVADVYCQGVGFEFANSWTASSPGQVFCSQKVEAVDGGFCDNTVQQGGCHAFDKIVCTGPKLVRSFIESGSGFGVVEFSQDGKGGPIEIVFKVDGLPKGDLDLTIHEKRVFVSCEDAGRQVRCNGKKDCGEITQRLGKLRGPKITATLEDPQGGLSLFGKESLEGKSIVFSNKKGERVACGSLFQRSEITIPDALLPVVQSGSQSQDQFEQGIFQAQISGPSPTESPTIVARAPQAFLPSSVVSPSVSSPLLVEPATTLVQESIPFVQSTQSADQSIEPLTSSRCPVGKSCPSRKCRTDCDNRQTCCRCQRWVVSTGSCAPNGWMKIQGPGDCNFNTSCPPGIVCLGVKKVMTTTQNGQEETCCECLDHHPDGSCKPEAFRKVRGEGECRFDIDPSLIESLSVQSGALPQGD